MSDGVIMCEATVSLFVSLLFIAVYQYESWWMRVQENSQLCETCNIEVWYQRHKIGKSTIQKMVVLQMIFPISEL